MDDSDLFYFLGLSHTYLTGEENRLGTRETSLQKHKNHVTRFLCVYGDGLHSVPVKLIGQSKLSTALK